jgi:TPR repeat protein
MYVLAMAYQDGRGVKKDEDAAAAWLIKAAQAESPDAMECLGRALIREDDPARQAAGAHLLIKAAAKDNIAAMRELADCYRTGRGVAMNRNEADRWQHAANIRAMGKIDWATIAIQAENATNDTVKTK